MGSLVNKAALDEITLSSGEKVWVRQRLGAGEEAALQAAMFHMRYNAAKETMELVEVAFHEQRLILAKAYVTKWDVKDDAGNVVPYEAALIDELDPALLVEITQGIDRLQAARREDAAKKGG